MHIKMMLYKLSRGMLLMGFLSRVHALLCPSGKGTRRRREFRIKQQQQHRITLFIKMTKCKRNARSLTRDPNDTFSFSMSRSSSVYPSCLYFMVFSFFFKSKIPMDTRKKKDWQFIQNSRSTSLESRQSCTLESHLVSKNGNFFPFEKKAQLLLS